VNTKEKGGFQFIKSCTKKKNNTKGNSKTLKKKPSSGKGSLQMPPKHQGILIHHRRNPSIMKISNNKMLGVNINSHKTWENIQLVQSMHPWVKMKLIEIRKKN
jgi:hypothetical protein